MDDWANLKKMFVSYNPHHKKIKSPGQPVKFLFYLIHSKYYFLFQMLPSP